jgi:hypothetical protein
MQPGASPLKMYVKALTMCSTELERLALADPTVTRWWPIQHHHSSVCPPIVFTGVTYPVGLGEVGQSKFLSACLSAKRGHSCHITTRARRARTR